jgi:outer membrane protein assembly factor BamB
MKSNRRRVILTGSRLLAAVALPEAFGQMIAVAAEDWPRFRGPQGAGVSEEVNLPVHWNDRENIVWKTPLPGFGTSSAVVVGNRIYLTCYSGYGLDAANPGREEDLKRSLLCLDRSHGEVLWSQDVAATGPEASYIDFLVLHGYASSTPTAEADRVYACFGKSGTRAFDSSGKLLWQADVGAQAHYWGSAASPVIVGERLIVNAAVESQSVVALDKNTGAEVWRAAGLISSWSTPVVADAEGNNQELVLCVRGKIVALDVRSGEQLWSCKTNQSYAAPSPLVHGGVIYAFAGRPNRLLAIRPGGRGDVTDSHVIWTADGVGSGITSPVLYGGYLYAIDDRGIAACVEAATGKVLYTKRLDAAGVKLYASPVAADGKIYAVSREQGTFVLKAGPQFDLLATNRLAGDPSVFNASPAVHDGQLLLRSDRFLYCLGLPGGQGK